MSLFEIASVAAVSIIIASSASIPIVYVIRSWWTRKPQDTPAQQKEPDQAEMPEVSEAPGSPPPYHQLMG